MAGPEQYQAHTPAVYNIKLEFEFSILFLKEK
jgi:hypothetical protein